MNGIKNFFNAMMYGVAATLGGLAVTKGIEVAKDPYKRAKVKRIFNNIKEELSRKVES